MLRDDKKSFRYFPVVKAGEQGTTDQWINIIYEDKDSIHLDRNIVGRTKPI